MIAEKRIFKTSVELALKLAEDVAGWLRAAIVKKDFAILAVSGGSTPKPFFVHLSNMQLDWSKVQITLVDERQVPEDNARSNAKLVKEFLVQNFAAQAQFIPLFENPNAKNLKAFDVVILGMGNDGHTASFFTGGDKLVAALDLNVEQDILEMNAPGAGEPRLTFSLARLLAATHLCLHIQGADKELVLQKALSADDQLEMPVRAVLNSAKPLSLYWCP
jgi:6-phosphogluconolactonase